MSFHQTIIQGNLGADPEMRDVNGRKVTNFNVAVTDRWTDRQTNERRERTTWYRVAVWGAQAESCAQYLSKGREVLVVGNVSANAYMNNAGEAAASLELNANNVQFLGGGRSDNTNGASQGVEEAEEDYAF